MSRSAALPAPLPSSPLRALQSHADDELLRMPVLWQRLVDGLIQGGPRAPAAGLQADRAVHEEARHLAREHGQRMGAAYLGTLRRAVSVKLGPAPAAPTAARSRVRVHLELVSEEVIALDVELSQTVQAIAQAAEQDLTDLQGYLAAMVGDFLVSEDHNPLPPATHAQALRAAVQVVPGSLAQRVALLRAATPMLAELLRQSYAAACERLAAQGLEPATHRLVIAKEDHRWRFMPSPRPMPDLRGIRDAMPRHPLTVDARAHRRHAGGAEEVRGCSSVELQSIELVSRLFSAFSLDERVPADVGELLQQLREPAMRLALRDPSLLDRLEHPLWRWIHLFAYQAEMVPHVHDADRRRWLEFGRRTIDQLAAAPMQKGVIYREAATRLEAFLHERLARRVAALSRRLDALQRTEAGLASRAGVAQDDEGPELDTVPAALITRGEAGHPVNEDDPQAATRWITELVPGQWLRLLLDGAWVHAQLLWLGDRRQIMLLGHAVSSTTWAVRRALLLRMYRHGLAKTLTMRSLVGTAALRVQEQLSLAIAAGAGPER